MTRYNVYAPKNIQKTKVEAIPALLVLQFFTRVRSGPHFLLKIPSLPKTMDDSLRQISQHVNPICNPYLKKVQYSSPQDVPLAAAATNTNFNPSGQVVKMGIQSQHQEGAIKKMKK